MLCLFLIATSFLVNKDEYNLQNVLHDLAKVMIRVMVRPTVRVTVGVRVRVCVRFRSEICKFRGCTANFANYAD